MLVPRFDKENQRCWMCMKLIQDEKPDEIIPTWIKLGERFNHLVAVILHLLELHLICRRFLLPQ
jgi:hypothetical protein